MTFIMSKMNLHIRQVKGTLIVHKFHLFHYVFKEFIIRHYKLVITVLID